MPTAADSSPISEHVKHLRALVAYQRIDQFRAIRMGEDTNLSADTRARAASMVKMLQPTIDALDWAIAAATTAAQSSV